MIRKATVDDIHLIRQMADVAFRQTYKSILSPDQMEYMMDMMYSEESLLSQMSSGHIFYIDDGRAYVSFRYDGIDKDGFEVYHLEKLYVLPEQRGCGLGRKMFSTVLETIRQLTDSPARIELNVNRNNKAVDFYKHIGMSICRSGDFPIGKGFYMNDYIMTMDF